MERIVQKFSIVYISSAQRTEVFRSIEEVPSEVRERLIRIARKSQVETLIIANEKGRALLHPDPPATAPEKPHIPVLSKSWKWGILLAMTTILATLVVIAFRYR